MERRRIAKSKIRKSRIKRDKKLRKKIGQSSQISYNSRKPIKKEIFKLPMSKNISWLRQEIIKMQTDLAVVIRNRESDRVIRMIKNILRNKLAQYWATYRTISSKNSISLSISDKNKLNTQKEYENLRSQLWKIIKKPESYKANPIKKILISKSYPKEFKFISIPSCVDKALQYLYLIILDVFQEEYADKDSYGFRAFRSPGWAAKAVTLAIWGRKNFGPPNYAIELNIKKSLDSISHDFIIKTVTQFNLKDDTFIEIIPKIIIENWLKSGYIDTKSSLFPKEKLIPVQLGILQSSPISSTIANMVLNGIQKETENVVNNSWIKLFRYADNCLIFLYDEYLIEKVLNTIKNFLNLRNLDLNINRTHIRKLYKGEKFQFVGFEFALFKNHNKLKIYNYPPAEKMKMIKEKIDLLFNSHKLKPYTAYYMVNSVLRDWCMFYSSGNSSNAFSELTFWLWKRTFKFWWKYLKYRKKYRISSQRQKKKLLAYDIVQNYTKKLPKTIYRNPKEKWWIIPQELNPHQKCNEISEPYFLVHPRSIDIFTPPIITGFSAYNNEERLALLKKSIYWKGKFMKDLLIKTKGICKLCGSFLLIDEEIEIHYIQPIKYGGIMRFTNLIVLCKECHTIVTSAVKNRNLELIYMLEKQKILKNVSIQIASKATFGETPEHKYS